MGVLYNATDGPNWIDNENWLSDAPLGEWYSVTALAVSAAAGADNTYAIGDTISFTGPSTST